MSLDVEGYRLSPQQRWVWQLSAAGAYTVQGVLELTGRCAASRLREALDRTAGRHEILRTGFVRPEGVKMPLQVLGTARPEWSEHDLSGLAAEPQDERLAAVAADERRPFDLAAGSPVRASLLRLAPERHALVLTLPALCSDARSLRNLVRELADVHAGTPPEDEPVQYLQYSEWQHSVREDEEQTPRGRDRWLFQGLAEPGFPPLARQTGAPAGTSFSPLAREVAIAPEAAADLASLAGRLDASLEEILRAAWHILAWRITGESPVTIVSSFDGRKHESLLDAQGPFAKLAPVSCDIGEEDTLATVAGRLRQAAAEAEEWLEHYAPEDYLSPEGDPGAFPLGFSWEEWSTLHLPDGLEIALRSRSVISDRTRLTLSCLLRDGRLSAEIQGDAACFEAREIDRWAESLGVLLAGLARTPDLPLGDLDVLTEAERQTLLVGFNRTETAVPAGLTAHRLFTEQVRRAPTAVAVEHGERTLTYADLDARTDLLARYLQRNGVRPDMPVGLFLGRSPELVVGMLGILKAGGAYLPLEPSYPRERLELLLSDTGAALVLSESALAPALPPGARVVCLDSDWVEIAAAADAEPADPASPENLAYILYTSGSTGRPKGVLVPHRGLVGYLLWSREAYATGAGQGAPVHSPIGFDLTVTSLWGPLVSGGRVVLLAEEEGVEALARALQPGAGFSLVKITPSHLDALALTAPAAGGATRALVVGGEALLGEKLAPWRAANPALRIFNEYGPTETVVGCCVHEVPPGEPAAGPVPIGRPIANTRLHLLNRSLRPVSEGAPGELCIGGQGVARGYLGQPAATAERFIPDPFSAEPGGRLYRTGDLARHLPSGELQFIGRTDGQVKIRGYRVELGEIEAALARHPAVGGAVVMAREDAPGDRRLVAYVAGQAAAPNTDELRRFLLQSLPEALVPSAFVALEFFPLTPNGKVDRSSLPVPSALRPDLDQPYVAPRNPVEQALAEIWAEVLGLERIGIRDNYFSLGGDSMRSVRVVALAQERGLQIELQDLFRFRTIEELASRIAAPGVAAPELGQAAPGTAADDELDRLLDEIEALSDEDTRHQLAERSAAVEGEP